MLIHRDRTTNRYAYGHNASTRQILGGEVAPPRDAIMLFTDIAVRRTVAHILLWPSVQHAEPCSPMLHSDCASEPRNNCVLHPQELIE